jgi:hypothetical protein
VTSTGHAIDRNLPGICRQGHIRPADGNADVYVGLTRTTTELVVIAPPELAARLG